MTHDSNKFDYLRDARLTEEKDITLNEYNDISITEGFENVKQSVAINIGHEISPLIGRSINGETLERVADAIRRAIEEDPQVEDSIDRVTITEINKNTNTVSVEAFTGVEESFEMELRA